MVSPPRIENSFKAKREHLLEAAVETFCDLGFAGATIVEISRRAGVADGTMYLYFKSKEALWREAFETKLSVLRKKSDRDLKNIADPEKRVAAFFRFHLRQAVHEPRLLLFLTGCAPPTVLLRNFHAKQMNEYWQRFTLQLQEALVYGDRPHALLPSQSAQIAICALSKICEALAKKEMILSTEAVEELHQRLLALALMHPCKAT